MLELININKTYGKNVNALKNINLKFNSKEFVAIIGPSGCGKTTLLNIIGGLDGYNSGDLKIEHTSTASYREKDWDYYRGNEIGFVFQNYHLLSHLTVYENVKLALTMQSKKDKAKILDALNQVGLKSHLHKYPHQLSGGECQRVAIARAIVNNPRIILADEPTGALDSKTSLQVMEILKTLAKDHLVIMVTHNEVLAHQYASRIIALKDGEVISDSNPTEINQDIKPIKRKKTSLSLMSAILLSFRHLLNKKIKTTAMIIAGSIGIIGLCLVLIFANIVNNYMVNLQKNTLANSPITIRSTVNNEDPYKEVPNYKLYPEDDIINVTNLYTSYYNHVNKFDEQFLNYLEALDSSLYNIIDYKTGLNLKILTIMNNNYKKVSTSRFTEMSDDIAYLETQYDVLAGKLPTEVGEIAILVDRYNNIDVSVLDSLGIDYQNKKTYTFSEMMQKEYRVILNDDAYLRNSNGTYINLFNYSSQLESLYNKSELVLKISGIIRISPRAVTNLYDNGILYSRKLTEYVVNNANESMIVKEQKQYGLTKDMLTGQPFEDYESIYSKTTKEYQYEVWLGELCAHPVINTIRIYTDTFRNRVVINDYLEAYNTNQPDDAKIRYSDYMGDITREFDVFINVLTNILVAFAAIALIVSTIMVAIITYISVIERTKEIGILRSLGARKVDIGLLFIIETALIGLISGVIGVGGGVTLLKPIINIITKVLKENNVTTFDLSLLNLNQFNKSYLLLIILGSVVLMMLAGLIPALIAAHKKPVKAIKDE